MILFSINDAYFRDVTRELLDSGVNIHTIVSFAPEKLDEIAESADIEIVDVRRFHHSKSILELLRDDPEPISASVLAEFAHVENVYLRLTDRLTYHAQPVRYRSALFRTLLQYWLRFFRRETSIGSAFFISAPHMGYDFVAYHAAKHLGVQTLFVQRSLIDNQVMLLEDYDKFEKVQPTWLQDEPLERITSAVDSTLISTFRNASSWSRHSSAINTAVLENRTKKVKKKGWRKQLNNLTSPNKWVWVARRLLEETQQSAFFYGDPTPRYRAELSVLRYRNWISRLRDHYEALAKPPEPGPYVFFAMHLQPERSTCPQGGAFDDQIYAIETLASALPEGCRLYVKEHPRQFWPTSLKSRHYRNEDFYARLSALPKVQLLPLETDTATMIGSALATATVTGSAGWESLLVGKPCLVFGVPWYIPCNSCHAVRSVDDCRQALAASRASTAEAVERDVLMYLVYFQEHMIHATSEHRFFNGGADYTQLVQNLARAIAARSQAAGNDAGFATASLLSGL